MATLPKDLWRGREFTHLWIDEAGSIDNNIWKHLNTRILGWDKAKDKDYTEVFNFENKGEKNMEIAGDKDRLIGLNVKIVKCNNDKYSSWYKHKINQVYGISRYSSNNSFVVYDKDSAKDLYIEDCKILLDDTFLSKFKSEKIAVNCETEEEFDEFYALFKETGCHWETYKEKTCITFEGRGCYYSPVRYYKEEGHTIIKYKDTVLPNKPETKEFIETEDFKEFVEYWKKEVVTIECNFYEEKKNLYLKISNEGLDRIASPDEMKWAWVYWAGGGYITSCTEKYKRNLNINYKDLKDWREILLNNKSTKVEEGGVMAVEYKILKNISIKSITEANPCNSDGEVDEFIKELLSRGKSYDYEITTYEEFKSFDILMKYKNWFLEEGFIEKNKVFEPFDITFRITSKDGLREMYHRLNNSASGVKSGSTQQDYDYPQDFHGAYKWFDVIKDHMHKIN